MRCYKSPCWVWTTLMPLMIWKREGIEFIDVTQFSTRFMALNRTFSWHGMDGTQLGIKKDGLQPLVLHPWMLALYIKINILSTWPILEVLASYETVFLWFSLLYFCWKSMWHDSLLSYMSLTLTLSDLNLCWDLLCLRHTSLL